MTLVWRYQDKVTILLKEANPVPRAPFSRKSRTTKNTLNFNMLPLYREILDLASAIGVKGRSVQLDPFR